MSRLKSDFSRQDQWSEVEKCHIIWRSFLLNDNNTIQVDILYFAHPVLRALRPLTRNCGACGHYRKSRPLTRGEVPLPYNKPVTRKVALENTNYKTYGREEFRVVRILNFCEYSIQESQNDPVKHTEKFS